MVAAPKYRSPVLRTVRLYQVSLLATFWNKALCDTWEDLRAANLQEGRLSDSQPSFIFLSGSIAAHCQEGTVLFLPWCGLSFTKDSFIKINFILQTSAQSRKHLPKPSLFLVHTEAGKVWLKQSKIGGCSSGMNSCGFSKLLDFSASFLQSDFTILRRESKLGYTRWRETGLGFGSPPLKTG